LAILYNPISCEMEVVNVVCKVASVEKISRNFLLRMLLLDRLRTSQIHEKNDD